MTLRMLMLLWVTLSALGLAASAWMVLRGWADAGSSSRWACPSNRASG